jgi:hypothetical protein
MGAIALQAAAPTPARMPPWSRPGKGTLPKFWASATARFWSRLAAPAAGAFAHSPAKTPRAVSPEPRRRRALRPCGALAGGIRPGHGSGINRLVGTPADARVVNLVDAYDPRLRPRLKKASAGAGSAYGKLSIEALILGCTRGRNERGTGSRVGHGDFFNGLALVTARRPSQWARQMPLPNGTGHESRQSKKKPQRRCQGPCTN